MSRELVQSSSRDFLTRHFGMIHKRAHAGSVVTTVTVLFIVIAALAIIMRLTKNHMRGSFNHWQQGDWLINRNLVEIRRGHIGSWLLDLADLFSVSPLTVVFVLHATLTVVLFYMLIRVFVAVGQPLILAPFVFSPPFFVIFWLPWEHGALRKETLVFIALLLTLMACIKSSRARLIAGAILLALSIYGHEANILFLPLFFVVLWLCRDTVPSGAALWVSLAIVIVGALHAFTYALTHRHVDEALLICQPLIDRGLNPKFCGGAIFWTTQTLDDALAMVWFQEGTGRKLVTLATTYSLTLIPLLFILGHLERRRMIIALALISALPFVPLYIIAVDWGRWVSMHVFSMMMLVMAALWSGHTAVRRTPPIPAVLAIMVLSLLWVPNVARFIEWRWYEKILIDVVEILS